MRRIAPYLLVLAFAAWCGTALQGDLAQLSPAPLVRSWSILLLAAVLSLLNYVVRIARWRSYLARLGHSIPLDFAALTYTAGFAYTLSPGKLGEMARARYYVALGVPLSEVAAAFFAERLLDLAAMVVLATLLLAAFPGYGGVTLGTAALVVIALAVLSLAPWSRLLQWLEVSRPTPGRLLRGLMSLLSALASTRTLLHPGMLVSGFLLGLVAWGLEGAGLGLLSTMLPPSHLAPTSAVGIYGIAVLIGGLSFLPGGLGSTEAVMTALLGKMGYPLGDALLITLSCRLVTLWLAVILGWLAVLILRQRAPAVISPWQS
jgi:glycosyltransferase 2 family protein